MRAWCSSSSRRVLVAVAVVAVVARGCMGLPPLRAVDLVSAAQMEAAQHSATSSARSELSYSLQPTALVQAVATDKACARTNLAFGDGCVITCSAGSYAAHCKAAGDDANFLPLAAVGTCELCPAGWYDAKPDETCNYCTQCESGFAAPGAIECSECSSSCASGVHVSDCNVGSDMLCHCAPGTASTTGTAGTFPASVSDACAPCGANTFQDKAGQGHCKACNTCPADQVLHTNCTATENTKCQCAPGHMGPAGAFPYSTGSCTVCGANTYQDEAGQASCKQCPANSVRNEAVSDATRCQCNAGFSGAGTEAGACEPCEVGTFKAAVGSGMACLPCPAGSNTTAEGSSKCECSPGFFRNNGDCTRCSAGTYKGGVGDDECTACPEHSTSIAGASSIAMCTCNEGYVGSAGSCTEEIPEPTVGGVFECDTTHSAIPTLSATTLSLTDPCDDNQVCNANPKYVPQLATTNDRDAAVLYCKLQCVKRGADCTGFAFQVGNDQHEVCAFFNSYMHAPGLTRTVGTGAVCERVMFDRDRSKSFIPDLAFTALALTDECSEGVCNSNPKYVPDYAQSQDTNGALAYCERECSHRTGCTGFFYQRLTNDNERCGFYSSDMRDLTWVQHSVKASAIAERHTHACVVGYRTISELGFTEISLTDTCSAGQSACNLNPKYVPKYADTNDLHGATRYCEEQCNAREGCTGFFYQKQTNGHEICGFYEEDLLSAGEWHKGEGAICFK